MSTGADLSIQTQVVAHRNGLAVCGRGHSSEY